MPLQNRVDPFGLIHAVPDRGLFLGNRGGCFHTADQKLKSTHWKSQQWITCVLEFKNRRRDLMQPDLYTELFFLDEATALAGGHRPCYECRFEDAKRFRGALLRARVFTEKPSAGQISAEVTGEVQSILRGQSQREEIQTAYLPDGAMLSENGVAYLKWKGSAHAWSFGGYGTPSELPSMALRLTPRATCAALANGYAPAIHPTLDT